MIRPLFGSMGRDRGLWLMLLLLAGAVLAPTAVLLWFMNRAIANEHLAVREQLVASCDRLLQDAAGAVGNYWRGSLRPIEQIGEKRPRNAFRG